MSAKNSANPSTLASKRARQSTSPGESPHTQKRSRNAASHVQRRQNKTTTAKLLSQSNLDPAQGAFSPSFQDSNNAQSQNDTATNHNRAQSIPHLPKLEALSKVDQSSLLSPDASSPGSDSQYQQALYYLVRDNSDSEQILAEITRHHRQGKQLPWFQEVIPVLRPGVEGEGMAAWLPAARAMLWDQNHNAQHKEVCERTTKLSQVRPSLPLDGYGLRRSWPSIIEGLRPISNGLATALDRVSCLLGRGDCNLLDPTGSWSQTSSGRIQADQTYVVIRQAIQDKIISPIIDDLSLKLKDLSKISNEAQNYDHGMAYDEGVTVIVQQGSYPTETEMTRKLLVALQHLLATIIDEKDIRDSASGNKKLRRTQ